MSSLTTAGDATRRHWPGSATSFLNAVSTAAKYRVVPEDLRPFAAAGTGGDPLAGFSLPESVAPSVLSLGVDVDPLSDRVRPMRLGSSYVTIPARVSATQQTSVSGGLVTARAPRFKAPAPSRPELEGVTFQATELLTASYAAERLVREAPQTFGDYLFSAYREELGGQLMHERIHGTGVAEFEGVLQCDATITVAKEVGQPADTFVGANVLAMAARCWRYHQAIWLAPTGALKGLMTVRHPDTDALLFGFPQREDDPFMLAGRPLFFTDQCAPLGDRGDLILGNWNEYVEGTLIAPAMTSSLYVRFEARERVFLFYVENDAKCWWRQPLTPANGGPTLSPFVTLEARP